MIMSGCGKIVLWLSNVEIEIEDDMKVDLYWKDTPMNTVVRVSLRGDMFTYCQMCRTRSHFQVDKSTIARHKRRCTCHNCGKSFVRNFVFPLPMEISK